jgi:hypothetical protein
MQSHGDMGDLVKLNSLWAARICGVLEPREIPACARRGICNVLEPRAFPGVLSGMAAWQRQLTPRVAARANLFLGQWANLRFLGQ